ncbi:MAG: peptidoglycan DD-metalloendopeptidase family protein [Rhodocyclaceae bacterium]|nr:peptidoglycan DD-metalloendopeptidase family protein [Rhodocyclaceae bacterium]
MQRLSARLLLALLLAPAPLLAGDDAAPQALQALRQRIEQITAELARDSAAHATAADQLRDSEVAISKADASARALDVRTRTATSDLARLAQQSAALDTRLAAQRDALGKLLARHYRAGAGDSLRHLLSGNDPNQLARDHYYLKALSQAEARLLAGLHADLAQQRALVADTTAQREALAQLGREQSSAREQLERERTARRELVARLAGQLAAQRNEITLLRQDEARMAKLAEELARLPPAAPAPAARRPGGPASATVNTTAVAAAPAPAGPAGGFAALRGQLAAPLAGELLHRYGSPRGGAGAVWKGVVIATGAADVRAVAAGRVVFADWLRGFGNLMIIDHGDTYLSIYGNNEALFKQVGDRVLAQDVIARTGAADGAGESGLYFELRHQGQTLDPLKWVRLR